MKPHVKSIATKKDGMLSRELALDILYEITENNTNPD